MKGFERYWSRKGNKNMEVSLKALNSTMKAMNSLPLIYNTNGDWMRSGNTGGTYKDGYITDNIFDAIPDTGIIQRLSYNPGYIKHDWDSDSKNLDMWRFYEEKGNLNSIYDAIVEFEETVAHEIEHEILQAYGGTAYSWQHKGSSYYFPQDTKPVKGEETLKGKISHIDYMDTDGEYYPKTGEIDLMKYYHNLYDKQGRAISTSDLRRTVVSEKDVLSLLWLTKFKIT
ncbi:hypothetical protein C3B47_14215 [Flavobacterium columnare]|nr:hypothetical protein [Flavobacterium columnare]MBF6656235.1 hypothetical protein [Flavobacterium columnare]MBF6658894.1 hypothetical protein [Flavobacterium columnare]PTD14583.1 hypothetical protein C6N29_09135 [Flavobacterium columnare]